MSDLYGYDPVGNKQLEEDVAANPGSFDDVTIGAGRGFDKGVGMLSMRAFAGLASTAELAGGALVSHAEWLAGKPEGEWSDPYFKAIDEPIENAVEFWTPRANEVGTAGQVVGGLAEFSIPLILGLGNPVPLIATQTATTSKELLRQGVDAKTATQLGVLQGTAAAVGFKVPALGKTLASKMITGAGGNVLLNTATTAAQQKLLEESGYEDLAKQYDPLNPQARMVDVLTGLGFGVLSHLTTPSQRAAIATVNNAKHFQTDTAPGLPADIASSVAHQEAMEVGIESLMRGEPVVAPEAVQDATFIPRETSPPPDLPDEFSSLDAERYAMREQLVGFENAELEFNAARDAALAAERAGENRVATLMEEGAPQDIVNPIDRNASPEEKLAQIKVLTEENVPKVQAVVDDLNRELPGTTSKLNVKEDESILGKAQRPSILEKKPWFNVEHVRDTLRFKTVLDRVDQLPRAIDVLEKHGIQVIKVDTEKFMQPDLWGWPIVALDLRMPNGQIVEHYFPMKEVEDAKNGPGHNLFEKWRFEDYDALSEAQQIEFLADRARSRELYEDALAEALKRTGESPDAVLASLKSFSDSARSLIKTKPSPDMSTLGLGVQTPLTRLAEKPGARTSTSEPSRDLETSKTGVFSIAEIIPEAAPLDQPISAAKTTVYTSTGRAIEVTPKVVEADTLVTSDTPGYPAGLQPRQRAERVASEAQVAQIAQNLKPELLGPSATADTGAPIVGPDNAVESGNGRVLAIRRVYSQGGGDAYRAYIESQGFDTTGMREPVLVRERVTPLEATERQAFAVEANKPTIMAMSTLERAQADAMLLDEAVIGKLKSGDLSASFNADFLRAFLGKLAPGERNAMMDATGNISQEGIRRAQAAILAKAYGRTPEAMAVLARMLESTDIEARSVLGALMDAAPAFAKLSEAAARGDVRPEFDVSAKVTKAVEELAAIRERGQALGEALKQEDIFTPRDKTVDALLKSFYNRAGTRLAPREQIATTLTKYAKQAASVSKQQGDIFGGAERTPEALLEQAAEVGSPAAMKQSDLFTLNAARQAAADPSIVIPTGEIAPDGTPVMITAAEALERSDQAIADAQLEANAVQAAIGCFMQTGMAA